MASELFPRLREIGDQLTDSNASLCSENSEVAREEFAMHFGPPPNSLLRDSSTMSNISTSSIGSISSTASKRKKKKAAIWAEKYETTAVVMGPVTSHEKFKELVGLVKGRCGEIKSHYYRDEQSCGFIYFHTEPNADKCKVAMHGFVFDGNVMKATSPSRYFENEDDAYPEPSSSKPSRSSKPLLMTPNQLLPSNSTSSLSLPLPSEPTSTLVIKNLCFGLKQEKLLEFMGGLEYAPQSVSYHYDSNGLFRGVAFAKYSSAEQAEMSLKELQGTEVNGRKLRVEFKRRTTGGGGLLSPMKQMSFDSVLPMDSHSEDQAPITPTNKSQVVPAVPECRVSAPTPVANLKMYNSGFKAMSGVPVVIRTGLEFEDAPVAEPTIVSAFESAPPPSAGSVLGSHPSAAKPILRAGFEFA